MENYIDLEKPDASTHGSVAVKGGDERAKLDYLYAFEAAFRKLCPSGFKDGMWTNAHMHFGIGRLSASDAALHFWNEIKPKK